MSIPAFSTIRATTTAGTRIVNPVPSTASVKTGATRSPIPGTRPMSASRPKRMFVPGTRKALSSSTAQRRITWRFGVAETVALARAAS